MSRNVTLSTKYMNGISAQAGWYNPKNADMMENTFTYEEYRKLIKRFKGEIKGKKIRGDSIEISVQQSYSTSEAGWFSVIMFMPINALERKVVFERINYLLNFKPYSLDLR